MSCAMSVIAMLKNSTVGKDKMPELSTTHESTLAVVERLTGNYRCDADVSLNGSVNYNLVRNSKQENSNREISIIMWVVIRMC